MASVFFALSFFKPVIAPGRAATVIFLSECADTKHFWIS